MVVINFLMLLIIFHAMDAIQGFNFHFMLIIIYRLQILPRYPNFVFVVTLYGWISRPPKLPLTLSCTTQVASEIV
jgi:hypothetical protein